LETTALVALGALPTLPNTYCYACPSGVPRHRHQPISANSSSPNATHSAVPMLELLRINLIAVKTNLFDGRRVRRFHLTSPLCPLTHSILLDNRLEYAGTSKLGPVLPSKSPAPISPHPPVPPAVGAVISQIKIWLSVGVKYSLINRRFELKSSDLCFEFPLQGHSVMNS
jgi:hypothetical protein